MTTVKSQKGERQYYIDWLRILLIASVFFFHIGMIFNPWDWHVKNDNLYGGFLKNAMSFLHVWRMPLFFLLSGAGTWFALGKRSPGQYLGERFKRLFIPLLVGIFTLVPVQVYIEKISDYSSLVDFYPHMFDGIYPGGNFSWHHLWFICYLFVVALLIAPFLRFFRSARFGIFTLWVEKTASRPLALNIFIIPLLLSQLLLRPYFETETHDLVNDWATMAIYVIFFMAGLIMLPNKNIAEVIRRQRYLYLVEAIILTVLLFKLPRMVQSDHAGNIMWEGLSVCVAWSCGIAAIGFARHHLNRDSKFRQIANEAIYPFYLLHQPVIVVIGYFIVGLEIGDGLKFLLITLSSFSMTATLYWLVIRPVNLLRFIFGMKVTRNSTKVQKVSTQSELHPASILLKKIFTITVKTN